MSLGNTTRADVEAKLIRKQALPLPLRIVIRLVFRPTRLIGLGLIICLLVSLNPDAPKALAEATVKQVNGKLGRRMARWSNSVQDQVHRAFAQRKSQRVTTEESYAPARRGLELTQPLTIPAMMFSGLPSNLAVTAVSTSQVSLSWTAATGDVDHYRVERSTSINGPFVTINNSTTTTSYNDGTVSSGTAYLYRVRAISGDSVPTLASNMAYATAVEFTDDTLTSGETWIKAVHLTELRTAVNAVRTLAGLSAASWTNSSLSGWEIKAVHTQEVRTALDTALEDLYVNVSGYEDPTLTVGTTTIRRVHVEELRSRSRSGVSTISGDPLEDSSLNTARLDPMNQTGGSGENPLSRNFNWSLPLLNLSGRSGMNLGLGLSYNSLVWTKAGSTIFFDPDYGFPGPGFRLGFPVLEPLYYSHEAGKFAYLLVTPDGSRTELRQVADSALYEAANSSHLLLDSSTMTLRTTDGTQLSYAAMGSVFACTQIKDRNGNYLTINYDQNRLDNIVDTLGRVIEFNYDNGWLSSITQVWNDNTPSELTHAWATFTYSNLTIDTNFTGLTVSGPADSSVIKVLTKVTLDDNSQTPANNSHFDFSYSSWGQIWKVSNYAADNHLLSYRSYNLPQTGATAQTDCPRFTERRDWAQFWMGDTEGTPTTSEEVPTLFGEPSSEQTLTLPDSSTKTGRKVRVTEPDGTYNEIYFVGAAGNPATAWSRGLPAATFTYDNTDTLVRKTMMTWTQDNESSAILLNPRVIETKIYDGSNTKRTTTSYSSLTVGSNPHLSCMLPAVTREYDTNGTTILRSNRTSYSDNSAYHSRRILGVPIRQELFTGDVTATLMAKVELNYDESGSIDGTNTPIQHDSTNYGASFVTGRGNLTSTVRFDINTSSQVTVTRLKYNRAGSIISQKDALNHESTLSYADSFSDSGNSRNTFAYPSVVTNQDGYSASSIYNFDFGAITSKQTPQPNTTQNQAGPIVTYTYDSLGRLERMTDEVNDAYTRFEYPSTKNRLDSYSLITDGKGEAHSLKITDGLGRPVANATSHSSAYSAIKTVYDNMGRMTQTSNPTETSASGSHTGWSATGADASSGWIYTLRTYDWKGRPLVTTQPSITGNSNDTTTKIVSYEGCGCAGGEVVTLKDEGTVIDNTLKRREKKIYHDILGRVVKTEILNWAGQVDTATVTTYNVRNQVTSVKQYAGAAGSSTFQEGTMTFDGYGRLKTQHLPDQVADPNDSATSDHTTWEYNDDDTIDEIKDARGVVTSYTYNNRHLPLSISYDTSNTTGVTAVSTVTLAYDGAGNRTSMSDGSGTHAYHYDAQSRLDWEERTFSAIQNSPTYRLSYLYNLGGMLEKVTDEVSGHSITTTLDKTGRPTDVDADAGSGNESFAADILYRASGAVRQMDLGNGLSLSYGYNARGMVTSYAVGTFVGADYQYYSNGQVKFADVLTFNWDELKDRAYAYDFAGRLAEAYSGAEARDLRDNTTGATPDGSYRRSYSYDQWDNMTSDSGRYWARETLTEVTYGTNNRVGSWSYDAEGNIKSRNEDTNSGLTFHADAAVYTYDAAGQQVQNGQSTNSSAGGDLIARTMLNTQTYDGDGQMVAYTLGVTTTFNSNPPNTSVEPTYLLRSSAMGGAVVSEYGPNGLKTTHIFVGSERIAAFNKGANGQISPVWRHVDPVTGDTVNTGSTGTSAGHTTFDPVGVSVGDSDPFPADGSGDDDGEIPNLGLPTDKGGASPIPLEDSGLDCVLDGIMLPCGFISGETSVQCPQNDCGPKKVIYQGEKVWAHFQTFYDGYSGFVPATAEYIGDGSLAPRDRNGRPKLLPAPRRDTNLGMMNGAQDEADLARRHDEGYYDGYRNTMPRRIGRAERSALIDDAIALLEQNGCEAALNAILRAMVSETGFDAGNIRQILENFRQNGTFYTADALNESSNVGTGIGGTLSVYLSFGETKELTTLTVIGEVIHWAGFDKASPANPRGRDGYISFYGDVELMRGANTAGYVMSRAQFKRTYPETVQANIKAFRTGSDYSESYLAHAGVANACRGPMRQNSLLPKFAKP